MMSLVSRFFTLESLQKALRGIHIPAADPRRPVLNY